MDYSPDEDDIIEENVIWGGLHATIFLIDVDLKNGNKHNHMITTCIKCIHSILCQKIRNKDNGLNAVVFYNSKNMKNSFDFHHIFNLQNLELSCAERILELEDLIDDASTVFEDKIGHSSGANLHDVFWLCRNIFTSHKRKITSKNILLFTTNDHPHFSDDHKIRQAFKGAKDLFEAYINLEVLPLTEHFDETKFYKELIAEWGEGDTIKKMAKISNPTVGLEELIARVTRLDLKQRTTAKTCFTLAPGSELGVKIFTYISKQSIPTSVKLYKVANEEIVKLRKETLENGELLMHSDFVKYQTFGNRRIKFMQDDIRHVYKTYETGIELLGFKPMSFFKAFHYTKPANLLYPDEVSIKGSTNIFACLHERCLLKKVCPVVRVQLRESSTVSWAYLYPQREEIDSNNIQILPPVFFLCSLPFADDFRSIEEKLPSVGTEQSQVDAAKEIIMKYNSKYNPEKYENPVLQTHWRIIEAYALNRLLLEKIQDSTVPNNDDIEKIAGNLIAQFKSLVFSDNYDPHKTIKKRPAETNYSVSKRMKPSMDSLSVEELAKTNKVDKLNIDALKKWLHSKGVKITGKKKQQLVQDVYEELGSEY